MNLKREKDPIRPAPSFSQGIEDAVVYVPSRSPSAEPYPVQALSKRQFAQNLVAHIHAGKVDPATLDFSGISLSGANLRGIDLRALGSEALSKIDFAGADLSGQNFAGLTLKLHAPGANLSGANLAGATLSGEATGANFSGAKMRGANITGLRLAGAGKFQGADLGEATISQDHLSLVGGANLAGTKVMGAGGVYTLNQRALKAARESNTHPSVANFSMIRPDASPAKPASGPAMANYNRPWAGVNGIFPAPGFC